MFDVSQFYVISRPQAEKSLENNNYQSSRTIKSQLPFYFPATEWERATLWGFLPPVEMT
jgi:hypothetical protein